MLPWISRIAHPRKTSEVSIQSMMGAWSAGCHGEGDEHQLPNRLSHWTGPKSVRGITRGGDMVAFWRAGGSMSGTSAEAARKIEAEGWDGQMFMDSQSLSADPYVMMGAWAVATERLKLSTGVTNPLTRHPVVTAAAAASLQALSHGRAVLGIGRGDSARSEEHT